MILLLRLLFSFCFDWEDISNTRDSVSLAIQTPQILSKILNCMLYFQLSSRHLDIPMKHCLLCLIYEMKHCAPITVTFLSLTVKSIFVIIYIAGNSYPFGRISSGLGWNWKQYCLLSNSIRGKTFLCTFFLLG